MLIRLGILIIIVGAMAGDSPSILAPISIMAVGAILVAIGNRMEGNDENADG